MIDSYEGNEPERDDLGVNVDHIDLPYWKRLIDNSAARIKSLADEYDWLNIQNRSISEYESEIAQLIYRACRVHNARGDTLEDCCSAGPLAAKLARYLPTARNPKQALARYFKQAAWEWVDEKRRELSPGTNRETPISPTSDAGRQLRRQQLASLLGKTIEETIEWEKRMNNTAQQDSTFEEVVKQIEWPDRNELYLYAPAFGLRGENVAELARQHTNSEIAAIRNEPVGEIDRLIHAIGRTGSIAKAIKSYRAGLLWHTDRPVKMSQVKAICKLRAKQWPLQKIADRYHCEVHTIKAILEYYGSN